MKRCPKCERDDQPFNKGQGWCKECQKAYRTLNADHIRNLNRAYQGENREKVRAWVKACDERHKAERKQAKRLYYLEKRDIIKARNLAYKSKNRERFRTYEQQRRTREMNCAIRDLTPGQWLEVLHAANHRCIYCQREGPLEMDHLIPLARGGQHTKANVGPACLRCNRGKGVMTADEWRTFLLQHPEVSPSL